VTERAGNALILTLTASFVVQGALFVGSRRSDRLDVVAAGELLDLGTDRLRNGGWHVLLVTAVDCPHFESVAAEWARWVAEDRPFGRIMITRADSGELHILTAPTNHKLDTELLAAETMDSNGDWSRLLFQTPWLYLLDPRGQVRWEGHGKLWSTLDSAYVAMVSGHSD
jgi:hypothetical protein